jgi:Sec7-like guanine-nucleotide exchange factor
MDIWQSEPQDNLKLENVLKRIEYNTEMKSLIEQAIILFNQKPEKAIEFLIEEKLISADDNY